MAARGRQKGGETQEHGVQVQFESGVRRKVRVHAAGGTAEGGRAGGDGHGLRQHRPQRADRQDNDIV